MNQPLPGTYGVVATGSRYSTLIQKVTGSEFGHAFVVTYDGNIVEAEPHGAREVPLSEYAGRLMAFNDQEPLTDDQRHRIVEHALDLKGTGYNFLDIAYLATYETGHEWDWMLQVAQKERRLICSQLVARCYYLGAGIDLANGRPDATVTPRDLAVRLLTRPWEG